jgi:hypothetical protein
VFFKIDGTTVTLTDSLTLSGTAAVAGTYGNHGNLINTDVDEGEDLPIPEALGSWSTASVMSRTHRPEAAMRLKVPIPGVRAPGAH